MTCPSVSCEIITFDKFASIHFSENIWRSSRFQPPPGRGGGAAFLIVTRFPGFSLRLPRPFGLRRLFTAESSESR
jgi:hypothetical protein